MHKKLKELRKSKKIKSKEMAEQLEISTPFYSQIENGQRRISYDMAVRIAKVFKTDPDKIFLDEYKDRCENEKSIC